MCVYLGDSGNSPPMILLHDCNLCMTVYIIIYKYRIEISASPFFIVLNLMY